MTSSRKLPDPPTAARAAAHTHTYTHTRTHTRRAPRAARRAQRACVRPSRAAAPQSSAPPPAASRSAGGGALPPSRRWQVCDRYRRAAPLPPRPPAGASRRGCEGEEEMPPAGGRAISSKGLSSEGGLPARLPPARPPARRGLPSPAPGRAARSGAGSRSVGCLAVPFPTESGKLGQVLEERYKGARRAREKGRLPRRAVAGDRCERGRGNLRAEKRREERGDDPGIVSAFGGAGSYEVTARK